jgi:hypothetical protein
MAGYRILLTPQEARLAQLLTRDAWLYFSNLISQREIFHVKDIPMMPRGGMLDLPEDLEIAQYYADEGSNYIEQLSLYGLTEEEALQTIESLAGKVEAATGIRRGMGSATRISA